jgi:hypothetical protein
VEIIVKTLIAQTGIVAVDLIANLLRLILGAHVLIWLTLLVRK